MTRNASRQLSQTGGLWAPFERHQHDMDRLIDDLGGGTWPLLARRPRAPFAPRGAFGFPLNPAVDIAERDDAYEIIAELPGLDENDIGDDLANGVLTIKGEKRAEKEEKKKSYYVSERSFGSFVRSFALPDGVDPAKIEATFKNGVLTVVLPKTVEAKQSAKKIAIKGA